MADSTRIQMGVRGVSVVTVSLDDTLSISGKAADAKAVGDALATKADISTLMSNVRITVDGQESDNQGVVLLYGEDIPVDDSNNAPTVTERLDEIDGKTATDINYAIGQTIKEKIDSLSEDISTVDGKMTGDQIPFVQGSENSIRDAVNTVAEHQFADIIPMSWSDTTTIAAKITAIDGKKASDIVYASGSSDKISDVVGGIGARLTTVEGNYLSKASQSLQPGEQDVVRGNIGLGDAATKTVRNDLTADAAGYVLDARQGAALNTAVSGVNTRVTNLTNRFAKQDLSTEVTYSSVEGEATIQTGTLKCYKFGTMAHLELGIKFGASKSANCQAWKAQMSGIPLPAGPVRGVCGTATYSLFTYTLNASGELNIRFVHNGTNGSATTTYTQSIEYIVDETGSDEGGDES